MEQVEGGGGGIRRPRLRVECGVSGVLATSTGLSGPSVVLNLWREAAPSPTDGSLDREVVRGEVMRVV